MVSQQLEVWKGSCNWGQFRRLLGKWEEGKDDMGCALKLQRYVIFLEECSIIEQAIKGGLGETMVANQLNRLICHKEQFFGRVRCLKVLNGRTRRLVIEKIKQSDKGLGMECLAPTIELVIEKVNELFRTYQECYQSR